MSAVDLRNAMRDRVQRQQMAEAGDIREFGAEHMMTPGKYESLGMVQNPDGTFNRPPPDWKRAGPAPEDEVPGEMTPTNKMQYWRLLKDFLGS